MATKTATKKGAAKKGAASKKGASSRALTATTASTKTSPVVTAAPRREVRLTASSRTPFEKMVKDLARQLTFKKPGPGGCNPCFSGLDRVIIENQEAMRKLR